MRRKSFAYFDTSVVAKRYLHEVGSIQARQLLRSHRLMTCSLAPVELKSLLARTFRDGILTSANHVAILGKIETDRTKWEVVAVSPAVLARAEELVSEHDIRTLDAIHLSAAVLMNAEFGGRLPLVTADVRQSRVATKLGLNLIFVE